MVPAANGEIVLLLSLMLVERELFGVLILFSYSCFLFLAVNCPQRLAFFFSSSSSWKHPVMADGGFRLWFRGGVGCWVMWREEMDSRPWAFPLVYSHWFTESTERKGAKNAGFLQTLSWWRWRQSGRVFAALHGVFSPLRSVVKPSLKILLSLGCSTGCCSIQYFHTENTQRISHQSLFFFPFSFLLVYFLIKKWNQLLKGCFEFQKDQWSD